MQQLLLFSRNSSQKGSRYLQARIKLALKTGDSFLDEFLRVLQNLLGTGQPMEREIHEQRHNFV